MSEPPGQNRPERHHVAERGYDPLASPLFSESQVAFLAAQRVARLATSGVDGTPHVVPVCFAFDAPAGVFYIALDEKPKQVDVRRLKRVRNILANPRAALLCDRYHEDWHRLVYCLIHAAAGLLEPGTSEHTAALGLLRAKYPQYRPMALEAAPVIALRSTRVTGWTGSAAAGAVAPAAADPAALRAALDFPALVRGRRSVRVYAETPVPRTLVEQVLEAGRWAPSPHGRLPWRFVVLTTPAAKQELAAAMGDEWRHNLEMDHQASEIVDIRLHKSYLRLLHAPVLIIPCLYEADLDQYPDPERQAAERIMAIQSLGAAAQNMLLAAYSLGLDGGWMCAPLFCPGIVRAALDLDSGLDPQAILTLGYATATPRRRARLPLADLIVRYD
ncbi:MAG TPA: TIGR03668 family PPOX class F420-dependent oxidoreductase [Chloroflexia bacterium]|nr:TIGR03668 family PPOX class F420-dependent oxidoreductase [Chloroflexia bacterium]